MPDFDDNDIGELNSSAAPVLDAQTVAAEAAAAEAANSSTATGETEDSDLLSVVRDVVKDNRAPDQTASPAEGEEGAGTPPDDGKTKEPTDDYSDVPFNKHPRFQSLIRERNALRVDAGRYNNVQNFMDQNNVGAEEAAELLVVGGLIKTDPAAAWARIKPTIQKLLIAAGEVLPQDLQERVAKGEMSNDAALEVSRSRASVNSVQATRSFEQQRREQQAERDAVNALSGAATTWEEDRRKKDPNFEAKLQPLMDRVYAIQRQEGIPNTPAGVQDQLNRAYKGLVAPAPTPAIVPPRPKTPVRGGTVAGTQLPETASTVDIIRNRRRSA